MQGATHARPRILHAPADVGGHAFGLSRAERQLGFHSDVAVVNAGPFGFGADIRLELEGRPTWRRLASRARLLAHALRGYDVIHFNFGQSFLSLRWQGHVLNELPLIKRAGKKILVTFQGCDVRPQECCFCHQERCRLETPYRAVNAKRFVRYADRCFHLNPDLARWLPGSRFVPYASVDPRELRPSDPPPAREQTVIAHAPTNREIKGTEHVLEAVRKLQEEGMAVSLDLIEGVPRAEVLRRLRSADVVVDQLLIGWYGGFAVEAMAVERPVLCNIHERTPAENPFGAELPLVRATPATLQERLRELLADRDARTRIGRASRQFVERHHDPRTIATEVLSGLVTDAAEPSTAVSGGVRPT